ncbi:diacylglycerol kinase family protein [Planctomicrobium sp. SH661]|uniref:diacylglycerol kinase family protein n=1 Tax=Planctomicrobium sp. SH661 TaxID=3448124 RepID=UPI003F5CB849
MRQRPPIPFIQSFQVAIRGIGETVLEQRNMQIHLVMTLIVIALAAWLQLPLVEWALLILCMGGVMAVEVLNTAIETVVDLVSPEHHELARKAKDISAGAVLISACMAAAIGMILLGRPIILLILESM